MRLSSNFFYSFILFLTGLNDVIECIRKITIAPKDYGRPIVLDCGLERRKATCHWMFRNEVFSPLDLPSMNYDMLSTTSITGRRYVFPSWKFKGATITSNFHFIFMLHALKISLQNAEEERLYKSKVGDATLNKCVLVIKEVEETDAGIWTCYNGVKTEQLEVELIAPPTNLVISSPSITYTNFGTNLISSDEHGKYHLECKFGHFRPSKVSVEWTVYGNKVEQTPVMEVVQMAKGGFFNGVSHLTIDPQMMNRTFGGVFERKGIDVTCSVQHEALTKPIKKTLKLKKKRHPSNAQVVLAKTNPCPFVGPFQPSVQLCCEVSIKPKEPTWYKFFTFVNQTGGGEVMEEIARKLCTIVWKPGRYICESGTGDDPDDDEDILVSPEFVIYSNTVPDKVIKARSASEVTLHCSLERGSKVEECFWNHQNTMVFDSGVNFPPFSLIRNKTEGACDLVIHNLNKELEGFWRCGILNSEQQSQVFFIEVI